MGLNVYLATQWKVIHPIPASFPLSAPVELEVVKAEGGLEWGHSSPVLPHQWPGLKETKEGGLHLPLGMFESCLWDRVNLSACQIFIRTWCSRPKILKSLIPLDFLSQNTGMHSLIGCQAGDYPSPQKHSSGSIAHLSENNRILEAQQGQGPALTTAEDQPLMHWSQVCDRSLISSTQNALFACVKWVKTRLTRTIRCWCPNHTPPHSH